MASVEAGITEMMREIEIGDTNTTSLGIGCSYGGTDHCTNDRILCQFVGKLQAGKSGRYDTGKSWNLPRMLW